ncbi:MAG: hypothetical protein IPK53_05035 [bacterium]|nr:hypothetical protein [bacterium]MBK8128322.1 hypothetical protein [bacterium]
MWPLVLLLLLSAVTFAEEQPPVQINFNLVQVNKYPAQEEVLADVVAPGQRIVIDVGNSETMLQYLAATARVPVKVRSVAYSISGSTTDAITIDWDTHRVFYAPSGTDSFLVSSSRTGCPGTEVAPSVAVAFPTKGGWSDPPIRFGPLTANTTCPLGHGFTLEVNGQGGMAPRVKLIEGNSSMYGKR